MLPQFFQRQLAVKIMLVGDAAVHGLGAIGRGGGIGLHGARQPVSPGVLTAQRRRHGLDAGAYRLPVQVAQRDARLPLHLLGRERAAVGSVPVVMRLRVVLERGGVGDHRPAGGLFLRREVGQVFLKGDQRQLQARTRHAADGDQIDFVFGMRIADAARHGQRRIVDGLGGAHVGGAEQLGGAPGRPAGSGFTGQAQLREQVVGVELAHLDQGPHQRGAGFAIGGRGRQQGTGILGHFFAAGDTGHQGEAFDLHVVVQYKQRILLAEIGPVPRAAQFEQPVVAQAVGDGGAVVPGEKGAHFVVGCDRQARFEPIILNVWGDRIVRQARGQLLGLDGVAAAGRFAQGGKGVVVGAGVGDVCLSLRQGLGLDLSLLNWCRLDERGWRNARLSWRSRKLHRGRCRLHLCRDHWRRDRGRDRGRNRGRNRGGHGSGCGCLRRYSRRLRRNWQSGNAGDERASKYFR